MVNVIDPQLSDGLSVVAHEQFSKANGSWVTLSSIYKVMHDALGVTYS